MQSVVLTALTIASLALFCVVMMAQTSWIDSEHKSTSLAGLVVVVAGGVRFVLLGGVVCGDGVVIRAGGGWGGGVVDVVVVGTLLSDVAVLRKNC